MPTLSTGEPREARARNASCPSGALDAPARTALLAAIDALAIRGLGRTSVARLIAADLVRHPADVFELTIDDLTAIGFAEPRAHRLAFAIEKARHEPLARWLVALRIPRVGTGTAKVLARTFSSFRRLAAAGDLEVARVTNATVARELARFLRDPRNQRMLALAAGARTRRR